MKKLMTPSGDAADPRKTNEKPHFLLKGKSAQMFAACCSSSSRKNGFSYEDEREMIGRAADKFLNGTYDPAKVKDLDHYAGKSLIHAVRNAAKEVADERAERNATASLDEAVGEDGGATRGDFVTSDQTLDKTAALLKVESKVMGARFRADELQNDPEAERGLSLPKGTSSFTREALKEEGGSWYDPDDKPVKRTEKVRKSWDECLRLHDNYFDIKEVVDLLPSPDKEICRAILSASNGSIKTVLAQAAKHCKVSPSRMSRTIGPRLKLAFAPFKDILTGGAKFQAARLSKQKCASV